MKSTALKDKFSNKAAAAGIAAMLTVIPVVANAADNDASTTSTYNSSKQTSYYQSPTKAINEASNYAHNNDAIGILIAYKAFEGATPPEVIGQKFVEALKNRNEKANFFIVEMGDSGYSVSFAYGKTGTKFMTINDAAKYLDSAVQDKNRMRGYLTNNNLHTSIN